MNTTASTMATTSIKNIAIAVAEKMLFLRPGDIESHSRKENALMLVHQLSGYILLAYGFNAALERAKVLWF